MKLATVIINNRPQLALYQENRLYPVAAFDKNYPSSMQLLLDEWAHWNILLREKARSIAEGNTLFPSYDPAEVKWLAPLPRPLSFRDGYAFRQHVQTARENRGLSMIPEFDQFPVFYFSNHLAIQGPGPVYVEPDHLDELDYELEAAIVIGKAGRDIAAEDATEHIAGMMILNDLSARAWQREEMKLNLGPAKGKDFASVIGPLLVTLDELAPYEVPAPTGHRGTYWNLSMRALLNNEELSSGNLSQMHWSFGELIERISYGVKLFPGEIIGSGTVGTGCLLELNGTAKRKDPDFVPRWLKQGDKLRLEIEALGSLDSSIEEAAGNYSIRKSTT